MDKLLSVAFDNISCKDQTKISKGIKQIEGVLAQICLSKNPTVAGHKRRASVAPPSTKGHQDAQETKTLSQLADDPAFREFFRLQDGFQWNG
jgi:hypothetical protein